VILDLEDAVSVAEKDAARLLVGEYLRAMRPPFPVIYIRINGLDTNDFQADLDAVVSDRIEGIILPKAGLSEVKALSLLLAGLESKKRLDRKIGILPIIELARSVTEIEEIARLPRLQGLLLGAEDLSADMEFERTKTGEEIAYPRARIAFACKANRIEAIDTPFTDTTDDEGLRADCRKAKSLGMTGKAAIHPNQLETIHEAFSPSAKRIEWAQRVLLASKKAAEQQLGVFSLDGKMIDKPIIERAQKILKAAVAFGLLSIDHE